MQLLHRRACFTLYYYSYAQKPAAERDEGKVAGEALEEYGKLRANP